MTGRSSSPVMLAENKIETNANEGAVPMADETRPTSFADYLGQEHVKDELRIRIRGAQLSHKRLEHILLIAPPGAGKTSLAEIIGIELGEPTETLVMPVKERVLIDTVRSHDGIVVMDELQDAPKAFQALLRTLLKDGYVQSDGRRIDAPWLTVIATTTDPQKLDRALYDRFHVRPELRDYTNEELAQIVQSMGQKLEVDIPQDFAVAFGEASLGSPRRAKGLVIAYRDLTLAFQEAGRPPTIQDALDLCHTEADGLSAQHIQYMQVLDTLGGTRGIELVSRLMRLNEAVVKDVERVLLERGLVAITDEGRHLLKAGYQRVQNGAHSEPQRCRR